MTNNCQRCRITIPTVAPDVPNMDNGLVVEFSGGYGEFIDSWEGPETIHLCHECGHNLASFLNLDVRNWHTHDPNGSQHADHHGFGIVEDGFGNGAFRCSDTCDLHVVRPGKFQCSEEEPSCPNSPENDPPVHGLSDV